MNEIEYVDNCRKAGEDRNAVETAKCLFIHRYSLLYRLRRISKLIETDLNDINVRMYLLLSYHIEMHKKHMV